MNTDTMLFGLILGIFMLLVLNWIYFFDWMLLIGGIVALIAPARKIKEVEDAHKLQKNKDMISHKRKWKLRFLLMPVAFAVVYLLLSFLTQQLLIAFFVGLVVVVTGYGVLLKWETKERETVIKNAQ